jgi:hypothetical protein
MNYEVYLRSRRLDLELDLEPPLALRLVGGVGFCSAESVERFTPRASGSADACVVLRLTGAADAAAADGSTADFAAEADAADSFAAAADAFLCAVASLARAFLSSRLASASFCFAAAAANDFCFASAAAASALVAPDISSSNANLASCVADANSNCGHSKRSSSFACLNGQSILGHLGLWCIGVHLQLLKTCLDQIGSFVISASNDSLIAGECIAATDACVV